MELIQVEIPGLLILKPDVYRDERGYFFESFNKETLARLGFNADFVQDNESKSGKGVLRGLHFQLPPYEQGKLVRVVYGAVLDVAVDLRRDSPYYGKWCSTHLSAENKQMFWLPPGFAHGFLALEDNTIFHYKCTGFYRRDAERTIRWNDPDLNIHWGISSPLVTEKDANAAFFRDFISPF
jgi:dTDP-4-dehydrorhamnose 3,5-epimerase